MDANLLDIFSSLTCVRRAQAKQYVLANMLLFCVFGILCGAHSYAGLSSFIEEKFDILQAAFPSKMKRAPAASTLWRIIGKICLAELEAAFRKHAADLHRALGGGPGSLIAYDGKSSKGSYDTGAGVKMSQLLRAFSVGTEIILGHIAIMEKSNEIPAMQTLLRELGLSGTVCTGDALHCQIKTVEAAKESGGDALLQVKSNQPSLESAFEALPSKEKPSDTYVEKGKIARNRQETREVAVFTAGSLLGLPEWNANATEAVRVTRTVMRKDVETGWKWRSSHEVAWFASTQDGLGAKYYATATRGHWGIENCVHRPLDVAMHEDASRVRKSPNILSILRSFALNILRYNKVRNVGGALWRNALNFNRVLAFAGT